MSIEDTLTDLIKAITPEVAAKVTGKTEGYLGQLTNPNLPRFRLTVDDALKLDLAHATEFGGIMPIYEQYGLIAEAAQADVRADAAELLSRLADSVKECGEMHAAGLELLRPGATKRDKDKALREWIGASKAIDRCGTLFRKLLGSGSARSP